MAAKKSTGGGRRRARGPEGEEAGGPGGPGSQGGEAGGPGGPRSQGEEVCGPGGPRSQGGEVGGPGYREEYAGQVEKLCRLGAREGEVAEFFGVSVEVLETWRREVGEFAEGMRRGRVLADAEVAERLFLRARGYSHEAVKIMQRAGEPVIVPYVEHYPPDTAACLFWLKNRRPDLWREKAPEEGGKKGAVMELSVSAEALAAIREAAGVANGVVGPGDVR